MYGLEAAFKNSGTVFGVQAGNTTGPSAPSSVTVSISGPYVTIGWQNGPELDLAGTKIEYLKPISDPFESNAAIFTEIFNVKSNTTEVTKYVGLNQSFTFRLSNYNTSNTFSDFVIVNGATNASDITNKLYILSSTEIGIDYYLWIEYINAGTIPKNEHMVPVYHFGLKNTDSLGAFATSYTDNTSGLVSVYATDFSNAPLNFATKLSGLSYGVALSVFSNNFPYCDPSPGYGQAIYGVSSYGPCVEVSDFENVFNIAYYSGTSIGTQLFWNHFNYKNSVFTELSVSSGILGGFTGQVSNYNTIAALNKPLILTNSGYIDNQVIVFTTGTQLGFVSINRSGLQNSPISFNDAGGFLSPQFQFDGCMDNNGNSHIFYQNNNNGGGICWYRYDSIFNQIGSGLNTLQTQIPGEAFPGNNDDIQWNSVRCFCDKRNEISLFIENSNTSLLDMGNTTYYYAKLDTSGSLLYGPQPMNTIPFNYSYFNVAYNPWGDNIYMNYFLDSKLNGISSYMPGGYRSRGIFKVINTGTKFEAYQALSH